MDLDDTPEHNVKIISDSEWEHLRNMPEEELVDLAVDLEILVPPAIDHRSLLERCVIAIVDRALGEGLPLSKYDRDDVEALIPEHLRAIASLLKLPSGATTDTVMRAGQRVTKRYRKKYPNSPMALAVPSLLVPIARAAILQSLAEPRR